MTDLVTTKPNMQTAARYKGMLTPMVDDSGKVTARDVHKGSELIPMNDCNAVISEITAALDPCTEKHGLVYARLLTGSYRMEDKNGKPFVMDPEIYTNTMAKKFSKYPHDICQRIVDEITDRVKWCPTPAEVVESGDLMMRRREAVLFAAKRHLSEHYRREAIAKKAAAKDAEKGDYEANLKKMYAEVDLEWPGIEKASIMDAVTAGAKIAT